MPNDQYPPSDQPPQNSPYGQPPPPYQPPPAWPPPPGGYYAPVPQMPPVNATLILVFGILGIVTTLVCGVGGVFGVVAWIMGNGALQTLTQVGDPLNQRGTVNAGRICGMVSAGLMALGVLFFVGMMVLGVYSDKHP